MSDFIAYRLNSLKIEYDSEFANIKEQIRIEKNEKARLLKYLSQYDEGMLRNYIW